MIVAMISCIKSYIAIIKWCCREQGQGTIEELRGRDFRKELEEREKEQNPNKARARAIDEGRKRQKVDQVRLSNLVTISNKYKISYMKLDLGILIDIY